MVEAMGLKSIVSTSPWMASPAYRISWKCTSRSNVISGGDTQTDWWFHKPTFIFGV